MTIAPIRATAFAGIPHGFLGREGGVSTGIHAGLNVGLGSDDDREAIHENRRRAVAAVAPGHALATTASAASRRSGSIPMPTSAASSASAAPPIAASRAMAARSR
jgi:hypothetical protein